MKACVATIGIMLVFGVAAAGTPFRGDQALFTQYAQRMNRGDVLYRDLWDVTNPGVYWFYQAAGTCFGFDEDGIHLFEWLWFTAFIVSVQRFVRARSVSTGVSAIPALFIGGWYYCTATADPSHLTKAEGLVAFPLFACLKSMSSAFDSKTIRERIVFLALAGMAAGIVVLFKFAFVLCLIAGTLPSLILIVKHHGLRPLVGLSCGFLLPVAPAIHYFVRHDALGVAFETLIVTPREMLAIAEPAGVTRLMHSVRWFIETSTPLIVLAAAGLLATTKWWRDSFLLGMVLVLPAALFVILIQKWSWWTYHFQLLSLPLAVIAAVTWPNLTAVMTAQFAARRWLLLLPLLWLSPLLHGASAYLRLLQHGLRFQARSAAWNETGKAYRIATQACQSIPFGVNDRLFVAGDPLLYQFARRPQATRLHGWALELFTPKLWQQLQGELKANPPQWIYIDEGELKYETLIVARWPELIAWIRQHYRHIHGTRHGDWYQLGK